MRRWTRKLDGQRHLATVSHELRTPLNAILGWTHLLRARRSDPATVAEGIEVIDRNTRIQVQLIDDLLDVSRIVSGKLRVNVRHTDLVYVVEAAVQSARPAIDAKQIRLVTKYDEARSVVWADPDRMQQVAWNLLSNAIKFTPRGGLVEVSLGERDGHVELAVRDTGQGIEREFLPHVFAAFRQADATTTRKHGGARAGTGNRATPRRTARRDRRGAERSGGEGRHVQSDPPAAQ